jgi:hypothetical protein
VSEDLDYCRAVEAYLCRKNGGHLIRIVGPAFELVSEWAERGVPVTVACRGIDRYFERHDRKGPRRRPVRIEFCEADVLDVFDAWRRSVGVRLQEDGPEDGGEEEVDSGRRGQRRSLPGHLDRVRARLAAHQPAGHSRLEDLIGAVRREIDDMRSTAAHVRGAARQEMLDRLKTLDTELLRAVRADCAPATIDEAATSADLELAPFRPRMPPEAYERARVACIDRGLRERIGLPNLTFE